MDRNPLKAVTFSFDDGVEDDKIVVDILNRYGLKGTFNLNSGTMSATKSWCYKESKIVRRLNCLDNLDLYEGHEIACHGYTHPHFDLLDSKTVENEIRLDKFILEHIYKCKVRGMAYPNGTYSDSAIEIFKKSGMEYGRTIDSTGHFDFPKNSFLWHPTCHFMDKKIMSFAKNFFSCDNDAVFYIWGHSYELMNDQDIKKFEEFCAFISNKKGINYLTNVEVLDAFIDLERK